MPKGSNTKYIFVSGGVISGVGKGIAAASIGFILKSYGVKISMLKVDPYLNVDAGTMNPLEHGETFVLEDGFETDMDIGHYERFTGQQFTNINSVTNGRIIQKVLADERGLEYGGRWISMDHHVPAAIVDWIKDVAEKDDAEVQIVEIGGTTGEIGQRLFLEANRMMKLRNPEDVYHVHVSYMPVPSSLGEMKTKPIQMSVRALNEVAIHPDFIVARSGVPMDDLRRKHLADMCILPENRIISAPNVEDIHEIPLNFEKSDFGKSLIELLGVKGKRKPMYEEWEELYAVVADKDKPIVNIGVIAKYFKSGDFDLKDAYVSVEEALKHAAWAQGYGVNVEWIVADDFKGTDEELVMLKGLDGVVVPQGWGSRGAEGKIKAIQMVRENNIPYLGLCYGMQMAVIEYSRNVLGLTEANSIEVDENTSDPVIYIMDEQKEIVENGEFGGTIRLGAYPCKVLEGSVLEEQYKEYPNSLFEDLPVVQERHRHRYEFNSDYRERLEEAGLVVSGTNPEGSLVEAIELPKGIHPFFIATQYHPELKSQFLKPHPLFMGFIKACKKG